MHGSGASNLEVRGSGGAVLWDWRIWGGAEEARKPETRPEEIDGALLQRSELAIDSFSP